MKTENHEKLRIGEVAKKLKVRESVIRYWQKEFNLFSECPPGGQRFYAKEDIIHLQKIKELLYKKGYTIAGAKKYFQKQKSTTIIPAEVSVSSQEEQKIIPARQEIDSKIFEKIVELQRKLMKLQELL